MIPADFDEQLQQLIVDFTEARKCQHSGRAEQVGGTAGIGEAVRRGTRLSRELNAILSAA